MGRGVGPLPAVLSAAERLIDPCKIKDPAMWAAPTWRPDPAGQPTDLGPGPWGQDASRTWVGEVRTEEVDRAHIVLEGDLDEQVDQLVAILADRGALEPGSPSAVRAEVVPAPAGGDQAVTVVIEPGRDRQARELLGGAARLASDLGGQVVALAPDLGDDDLTAWGADEIVRARAGGVPTATVTPSAREEDVARAVAVLGRAGPAVGGARRIDGVGT